MRFKNIETTVNLKKTCNLSLWESADLTDCAEIYFNSVTTGCLSGAFTFFFFLLDSLRNKSEI